MPQGVEIRGPIRKGYEQILTAEALGFIAELQRRFGQRVEELLERRRARQLRFDRGAGLDFLPETEDIRRSDWTVGPLPDDLQDRRVEITGPVDRKMIINALSSGANVFMADFEDSNAPTWDNTISGQINLRDAVRGTITYDHPATGKHYELKDKVATLFVRARGWHLKERHISVDGLPMAAGLVDFGLFFFHNAKAAIAKGTGPYFYLPKLESYLEARLWNDVFRCAQDRLGIPQGTIKATVLIETLPAAFQMDEILYELREHSAGLNCGRWDYIFSFIKTLQADPGRVLPDRGQIGMNQPFMRAYAQLAIQTCHRRKVHSMGGMAAQIPIKNDPAANEEALAKVRADKLREVTDGHDGTWVAHPGLVGIAREIFDEHMKTPNQIETKPRADVRVTAADLLRQPEGTRTLAGLRHNVRVAIQYLEAWLNGNGCVPLYNLMEDAATAEISRAQLWQWIRYRAALDDGTVVTEELVGDIVSDELQQLQDKLPEERWEEGRWEDASALFEQVATADRLADFLTLPAYEILTAATRVRGASAAYGTRDAADERFERTRWEGIKRPYTRRDVDRLKGSFHIEHTLARRGARKLWELLETEPFVRALGALSGNQAVQMVRAGLKAIYCSGWQIAADINLAAETYPDQSLYPANSAPALVNRLNSALLRADQIEHSEGGSKRDWVVPIVADGEAGFGGPLNAFELMKSLIRAGAAGVHYEDQLSSEKKCGHLGGKVLIPTGQFIRTLVAARLAADVMDVPTILIARTDADSAKLLTSDIDPRDREFLTGERTPEGFFRVRAGVEAIIARLLAYAPYADLLWFETSRPSLDEARQIAEAVHKEHPGKKLAYNCSPSFNWKKKLDEATIAKFQRELGAMGYKFQFVTLAGFHALNLGIFELAKGYSETGMTAYSELQAREFSLEEAGYTATRHQREVGTGYFDDVRLVLSGGDTTTSAMEGSTEAEQF